MHSKHPPARPIEFHGEAAKILWSNIRGHLDLLESAKALMVSGNEGLRHRGIAFMVAFMISAAWGYQGRFKQCIDGSVLYDSLEGRLAYLLSLNPAIYRLSKSKRPVELHIFLDDHASLPPVELGHHDGFSAVLPLTKEGYLAYYMAGIPISELMDEHIVRHPHEPRSVEYLAITGMVDCKALPEYLNPENPKNQFPRRARRLLDELAGQIRHFASAIDVYKDQYGKIYCESVDGHERPLLFSPLSGRGMGEDILETAGFRSIPGVDQRENVIWELDFKELNTRRVEPERLAQILRAAHFVSRNLPSPV